MTLHFAEVANKLNEVEIYIKCMSVVSQASRFFLFFGNKKKNWLARETSMSVPQNLEMITVDQEFFTRKNIHRLNFGHFGPPEVN